MKTVGALDIDANYRPFFASGLPFRVKKTITFDGATTDAIGNDGGALDPFTIFTVTGVITLKILPICTTLLDNSGAATLALGISATAGLFIAATTASAIDANEIWVDTSPDVATETESVLTERILSNGQDIIGTVAGADDIDSGIIDFYAFWRPISDDGNLVAA